MTSGECHTVSEDAFDTLRTGCKSKFPSPQTRFWCFHGLHCKSGTWNDTLTCSCGIKLDNRFSVCVCVASFINDRRYYQQEISYSDDPFTDFIEPAVPFVLGTLVRNAGAGEATDVSLVSGQPEIIENEKGGPLSQVECLGPMYW